VHVTLMQELSPPQPHHAALESSPQCNAAFSLHSTRPILKSLALDSCLSPFNMRLLKFDEEGEPSLVEFVGTDLPPYAILSHTWGADVQEVTYQDIEDGVGKRKDGWRKLQFCNSRAKHDGLQYCWVDTCCIDKSSSAELSEAINSMFSWYHTAERCYVYLSDVSNDASNDANDDRTRRWKPAFKRSAWFTRGWTLQELIAPTSVEFFSHEGVFLGSRTTLEQTIHEITGIAVEALRGTLLSRFTKEERLSWAAKRMTKRGEDAAYCLLGIFDVFIPPIYGEGRENALARLEEQIEKTSKGRVVPLFDEQKVMLMDSLRFEQIDARHTTIKRAHAKTCKWLLSNDQYRNWLDSEKLIEHRGFLWIRGKPGAGKSTLMKFALADARKTKAADVVIAFFFNARGDDMEKSTLGMYRSLLLQLLEQLPTLQSCFESLHIHKSHIGAEYQWSLETLQALFEEAVQSLEGSSVICYIDALDECEEQQIRNMVTFFESVGELGVTTSKSFQVCFSSRHYPNITLERGLNLVLEGQEGHTQDIVNYVKSELKIGESKVAQQIRHDLEAKAAGVFMWVVLVVDILKQEYDRGRIHALKKRLNEIPANLHELFRDILTRDSRDQDELILCIQWVLFAKESLSPEQLYYAILAGIEPDALGPWNPGEVTEDTIRHFILDASKGLTETTKSKYRKVQFIHESVRDFLLKEDGLGNIWPNLKENFEGQSHDRLKTCCLTYMDQDVENFIKTYGGLPIASSRQALELRDSVAGAYPFMTYAVQNVLYHADKAEGARIAQQDFVGDFPMTRWIKLDNLFEKHQIRRHTNAVSILYVSAERNMANLVRSHPSVRSCFDISGERYGTPFLAAIATGSKESIHAFVDALEDDENWSNNIQRTYTQYYQDAEGRHLLSRDFKYPKEGIIMYLLSLGNKAILALALRACELDVNIRAPDGRTPLIFAAAHGLSIAVELLLATGRIDIDLEDKTGLTALLAATTHGHRNIVKLLLDTGRVDANARKHPEPAALTIAIKKEYQDIVKLLLEYDEVDVNARAYSMDPTPLIVAVRHRHKSIVELLLGCDRVEVNAKAYGGVSALAHAAKHGYGEIVELLINNGKADVNQRDRDGLSPLVLSMSLHPNYSTKTAKQVAELVLSTGQLDINSSHGVHGSALMWAIQNGHPGVAELLLNTGKVDINTVQVSGLTPLNLAVSMRDREMVELLLKVSDIDVNAMDKYRSPLGLAVSRGYRLIAKLLLDTGKIDFKAKDKSGRTALEIAIDDGRESIVELLLDTGRFDLEAKDSSGKTAMHRAIKCGRRDIVKSLLDTGEIDLKTKDNSGGTALHWAIKYGGRDIVELLLSTGKIDLEAADISGRTPLQRAMDYGKRDIVELLQSHAK
jgi:ankyrin repeat protein